MPQISCIQRWSTYEILCHHVDILRRECFLHCVRQRSPCVSIGEGFVSGVKAVAEHVKHNEFAQTARQELNSLGFRLREL